VSSVPSAFKRPIRFLVVPHIDVNVHPIIIFPSDWIAIVLTVFQALGLNHVSSVPSAFKRPIRFLVVPHIDVNAHPIIIFPSD